LKGGVSEKNIKTRFLIPTGSDYKCI
jgi:hypothetical protein